MEAKKEAQICAFDDNKILQNSKRYVGNIFIGQWLYLCLDEPPKNRPLITMLI